MQNVFVRPAPQAARDERRFLRVERIQIDRRVAGTGREHRADAGPFDALQAVETDIQLVRRPFRRFRVGKYARGRLFRSREDLLSEYDFPGDDIPVIQGSALKALEDPSSEWGDKIMELMDAVDSYIPDPQRDTDKPFVMPVEDVFSITGRGTVATGRVEAGVLHVSDEVEIVGIKEETRKVVVTGIEMFRKLLDEAQAGDNIGALLRGVQRNEIERGQVLAKPGTLTCHTKFTAQVYVLTKDEGGRHTPFFNNYRPQFYFRTTDVTGVCNLPEGTEMCMPGDNIEMTIELIHPIAMAQGLTFAIREGGRTVGSGRVATVIE